MSLQQQVDIWIQQAGPTTQGRAFNTLNGEVGQSVNGYPVTQGTVAACAQFGGLICSKDLASLNASGQCPSQGNGGVRATGATLRNGTANLDGNSQSICSWGQVIQKKIDASGCSNGNQASPTQPINCPSPTPATGGLMAGAASSGASAHPPPRRSQAPRANPLSPAPTLLFQAPKSSADGVRGTTQLQQTQLATATG